MKQAWHYPWIFAPNLSEAFDSLCLSDEEFRHVVSVLRCRQGEALVAFDGNGGIRLGTLHFTAKQGSIVFKNPFNKLVQSVQTYNLVQCLPNTVSTFEIILRKCCELGVHTIYPILGEHSERKQWSSVLWEKRKERFQRVIIESCKQAKNPYLPRISKPTVLQALDLTVLGKCFHGSLLAKTCSVDSKDSQDFYSVIVGPEGGFAKAEEAYLSTFSSGICLPTYVLRVETAVVSLLTAIKLKRNL